MRNCDSPSTAPTERELRLAAEWMRVARLISASIQSRIDFDPDKVDDPLVRYAPLKLCSTTFMYGSYTPGGSRVRPKITNHSTQEVCTTLDASGGGSAQHQRRRLDHMDSAESWNKYGEVFLQEWFVRLVIIRLRAALCMHKVSFPGAAWMARDACKNLRRLFPPAQVIPIRA